MNISDDEHLKKDRSYAPSSGRETERLQDDQDPPDDVDASEVRQLPGTGGPDDSGDVEVDESEIRMPRDSGAH